MTQDLSRSTMADRDDVSIRPMQANDVDAVLAFARDLPQHDLLFLPRDIRIPKVVAAWSRDNEGGELRTLLAWRGRDVVGCGTVASDPQSWSAHVAEIRTVIAPAVRGHGLGTRLVQETFRQALLGGAEKIFARMTTDQASAIAVFEGLGFRPEAILRNHVRDQKGQPHDVVVLSHLVGEVSAAVEAYGIDGVGAEE